MEKHEKTHSNERVQEKLKIGSFNICRGLNSKETLLLNLMENEELDIIGVHETDISDFDESTPFTLSGFKTYWPIKRTESHL